MSLLGEAAMVFWHDITDGDDDYKDWHSNEHMSERVGVPQGPEGAVALR